MDIRDHTRTVQIAKEQIVGYSCEHKVKLRCCFGIAQADRERHALEVPD